jgi:hypothetical protein
MVRELVTKVFASLNGMITKPGGVKAHEVHAEVMRTRPQDSCEFRAGIAMVKDHMELGQLARVLSEDADTISKETKKYSTTLENDTENEDEMKRTGEFGAVFTPADSTARKNLEIEPGKDEATRTMQEMANLMKEMNLKLGKLIKI